MTSSINNQTNYYDPGTGDHLVVDGQIVERDALRIAEAVQQYDPNLVVLCLDPARAEGLSEEPFIIAERGPDGILRPVLRAWQLDDTVLARLYFSDTRPNNGMGGMTLEVVEEMERRNKDRSQYTYNQWREEVKDIVAHIAGMKSKYSVHDTTTGELLTFFDDRPAIRGANKSHL